VNTGELEGKRDLKMTRLTRGNARWKSAPNKAHRILSIRGGGAS
jgi:hypothetical protein